MIALSRCLLPLPLLAPLTSAQDQLLITDSLGDRVMLYSAEDGALINKDFIPEGSSGTYEFGTPKEAVQVEDEIWVIDQVEDAVHVFDLTGAYLRSISSGVDNLRGIAFDGSVVYITNAGSQNGAPGPAILMFDSAGASLGSFASNSVGLFDVSVFGGELLVTDFLDDVVDRYSSQGTFLGQLVPGAGSTSLNSPQQLNPSANGTLRVAGFGAPLGLYEFDASGMQLDYVATSVAPRAVRELGNGSLLYTSASGVFVYDPLTQMTVDVSPADGASGQGIGVLSISSALGAPFCTPAVPNSTGVAGVLEASGSALATDNDVTLTATQLPLNQFGYFLNSLSQTAPFPLPSSQGMLCLGGQIGRYNVAAFATLGGGQGELALDLTQTPTPFVPVSVLAGESWSFQCWYRDFNPGPTSNLTNAVQIDFL